MHYKMLYPILYLRKNPANHLPIALASTLISGLIIWLRFRSPQSR